MSGYIFLAMSDICGYMSKTNLIDTVNKKKWACERHRLGDGQHVFWEHSWCPFKGYENKAGKGRLDTNLRGEES